MHEERLTPYDRAFLALAVVPCLLVFLIPMIVDRETRMPVVYAGVGLSLLLLSIGLWFVGRTRGAQRRWLVGSTVVAGVPFVLLASSIGLQWVVYFFVSLFKG